MPDAMFNYLPSQSLLDKKTLKPRPSMTPPTNAKKKTKSPYLALMEKVKTAKAKATAIRKSKKQKTNTNGVEFLQNMPSMTVAVHDRLGNHRFSRLRLWLSPSVCKKNELLKHHMMCCFVLRKG